MSLQEAREEAEAVLDSAEMILETYGGAGEMTRKLESKITELEKELQEPESESSIREIIEELKKLMEKVQSSPGDDMMDEDPMGPGEPMGGGPDEPMGGPDEDPMF